MTITTSAIPKAPLKKRKQELISTITTTTATSEEERNTITVTNIKHKRSRQEHFDNKPICTQEEVNDSSEDDEQAVLENFAYDMTIISQETEDDGRNSNHVDMFMFDSTLHISQQVSCLVSVSLLEFFADEDPEFADSVTNVKQDLANFIFKNAITEKRNLSNKKANLKVADFGCIPSAQILALLEVRADTLCIHSQCALAYLRGLLERKEESAVVPLPNDKYQLRIFVRDEQQAPHKATKDSNNQFAPLAVLCAALVRKPNLALDLDYTLIRTRLPSSAQERARPEMNEHEFSISGTRLICAVRPGTNQLLRWASILFNIYIFTNSTFEYAVKVAKILDPNQSTILKGIDVSNEDQLKTVIKSREVMSAVSHIEPPMGEKDLQKFNLHIFNSIALDDDIDVWRQKENVLCFDKIAELPWPAANGSPLTTTATCKNNDNEFFYEVRNQAWTTLKQLSKRYHQIQQQLRAASQQRDIDNNAEYALSPITYSQAHVASTTTTTTPSPSQPILRESSDTTASASTASSAVINLEDDEEEIEIIAAPVPRKQQHNNHSVQTHVENNVNNNTTTTTTSARKQLRFDAYAVW